MNTIYSAITFPAQVRTRVDVFEEIFLVFLALGTLVGIVVVAYTLYNAYKYRDTDEPKDDTDLPSVGELPTGGKGGKKLFLSFGLSAIIVISLVIWTYGMLLYVEDGPDDNPDEDGIEMVVDARAFGWDFYYGNGAETTNEIVVPAEEPVWIEVTSQDVWHTFGISDLRVKADAIPGEVDQTWFMADAEDTGEYTAECFELCGFGHSGMTADVEVVSQDEYDQWMHDHLTLTIELEDAEEEPVTEGFQIGIEHVDNDELEDDLHFEFTADSDEFENGTLEVAGLGQGGEYDVTITPEDDEFEEIEDTVEVVDPTTETYTLEGPDADDEGDEADEETDEDNDNGDDTNDGGDDE